MQKEAEVYYLRYSQLRLIDTGVSKAFLHVHVLNFV